MAYYTTLPYNTAALHHFVTLPVSDAMIQHLAAAAAAVITCETTDSRLPPSPPSTPPHHTKSAPSIPSLELFILALVRKSNVQVPTLMTTLLYLARLQARLPSQAKGLPCTTHRIFLAALILSSKFLNDSSPKNKHWAAYSHISSSYPGNNRASEERRGALVAGYEDFGFSRTEVNLMEKQLLSLLEWDLNFREEELMMCFEPFLRPIRESLERKAARKMAEREREVRRLEAQYAMQQERERDMERERKRAELNAVNLKLQQTTLGQRDYVDAASVSNIHPAFRKTSSNYSVSACSPPSVMEVPELSVSMSRHGSSTDTSYLSSTRESSRSRSQTPASTRSASASTLHLAASCAGSYAHEYEMMVDLPNEVYANSFVYGTGAVGVAVTTSPEQLVHLGQRGYAKDLPQLPVHSAASSSLTGKTGRKGRTSGFLARFRN